MTNKREYALFFIVHPDATATLHSNPAQQQLYAEVTLPKAAAATFDSLLVVCSKRCSPRVPKKIKRFIYEERPALICRGSQWPTSVRDAAVRTFAVCQSVHICNGHLTAETLHNCSSSCPAATGQIECSAARTRARLGVRFLKDTTTNDIRTDVTTSALTFSFFQFFFCAGEDKMFAVGCLRPPLECANVFRCEHLIHVLSFPPDLLLSKHQATA